MNEYLAQIADALGPVALILGVVLGIQVWRLQKRDPNPVATVVAIAILAYQVRNFVNSASVFSVAGELVRPTQLLVTSIIARAIEIAGDLLGVLYFAGKIEWAVLWIMKWFFDMSKTDPHKSDLPVLLRSGDMPPEYWDDKQYQNAHRAMIAALHSELKPELLRDQVEEG